MTLGLTGQRWSNAIGHGALVGVPLALPAMLVAGFMTGGI
jgi:hypothetical protein